MAQIGTQRTPLWLSTGTRDPDAPPAAAQAFVSQVAKVLTQYVGLRHSRWPQSAAEAYVLLQSPAGCRATCEHVR